MLVALISLVAAPQSPDDRAVQVVLESVRAYRQLRSYFDRGTVAEYVLAGGRREAAWPRTEVQAWYQRPSRLRIQAFDVDRGRRAGSFVLWPADRGSYRLWSTWGGVQRGHLTDTLSAAPTRVGEFVETVLSQVDSRAAGIDPLLPLVDGRYLGVKKVDGWACDVVQGESERFADVTLWIDQKSRLIRQVRTAMDGGKRELVVSLKPLANPTFAPGTFTFVPPK